MALRALMAGKHVLVEKPLALNRTQLDSLSRFVEAAAADTPVLQTGFNRRHSNYICDIARITNERKNPMIINYTVNAGYLLRSLGL